MGAEEKTKKALYATKEKIEAPFKIIKEKQQQMEHVKNAAKDKVETAKKLLNMKELANNEAKSRMDKTFGTSIEKIEKAKRDVEDSQREFLKAEELVKSLIAKLEVHGKSRKSRR